MKTKLLLCKTVEKLGIVGDVVEVSPGYARNYLVPLGLATKPTETNVRALAEARKLAEKERLRRLKELSELAEKLEGFEVTIRARTNEDGVLYGSVGQKGIAEALEAEGFPVRHDQVSLAAPIRHLDNLLVDLKLGGDTRCSVKVWVVRDKIEGEDAEADSDQPETGMEAGDHGDGPDE
ncbi:MAG: 50S ribosomal protein L9 [Chloroflexi bacterium]|nr:50S ribosomal protein L9 [Chloroflexota bacterium]